MNMLHLMSYYAVIIPISIIWTLVMLVRDQAHIFILIHIHITHIAFIFFIICIICASLTTSSLRILCYLFIFLSLILLIHHTTASSHLHLYC